MKDFVARKLVEIFFLYFFRLFPVESIFQFFSSVTLTPGLFFLDFLHALFFQVSVFSLWWFFCTDGASAHNLWFSIVKSHFVTARLWFSDDFWIKSVCYSQRWLTSAHGTSILKWAAWAPDTANKTSRGVQSTLIFLIVDQIVLNWSGMGQGMSLGRTFFVSCFLWKVMILLCCYSSSTSHIIIKRLDCGFSVFQICSEVRKRYEWGIGKSRNGILFWSLWLPIQCYIKILWRIFFVNTVSTEESWEGCEGWSAHSTAKFSRFCMD